MAKSSLPVATKKAVPAKQTDITESLSDLEPPTSEVIERGLKLSDVYRKLSTMYHKCFIGRRNPDRAHFIEFLDQNIAEFTAGDRYRATITKRTTKPDPEDMRRSVPAEEETRIEGAFIGFAFKEEKLHIILLEDSGKQKKVSIDPASYFPAFTDFSHVVAYGEFSYSDTKGELLRLERSR